MAPTEKTLVDVDTIDNFCEANSINAIDILKLDIQGNELEALLGASKMLSRGDIHLVYSEAIFVPTYSAQSSPNELMNFLYSKNYILVDILNSARSNGRLYQADLLFVSSKLLP